MTDRAELVEKVVKHVERYDTPHDDDPRRRYTKAQMEIAIGIVLEEAARVADRYGAFEGKCFVEAEPDEEEVYDRGSYVARSIAAAIRALIKEGA